MPKDSPPQFQTKIFVVDDHPIVRDGLRQWIHDQADLQLCGEAAEVEDAIRQIEVCNPDIVIVDIVLKGGNGLELIKQLRATGAPLRILAWSMYDPAIYRDRALNAGADLFISKDQPTEHIGAAIRELSVRRSDSSRTSGRNLPGRRSGAAKVLGIESFSNRELEVFTLIGEGLNAAETAERLGVSDKTIETYRARIKQKLDIASHAQLVRRAVQWVLESR